MASADLLDVDVLLRHEVYDLRVVDEVTASPEISTVAESAQLFVQLTAAADLDVDLIEEV